MAKTSNHSAPTKIFIALTAKRRVAQAGLISAYEEFATYLAGEEAKRQFKGMKGFVSAKLTKPVFAFTTLP